MIRAHFQGEQRNPTLGHRIGVRFLRVAEHGLCRAKGDFGRERGFAHAGAARDDEQIGRMQPARFRIQITQTGGKAGNPARRRKSLFRMLHGDGQRALKSEEAPLTRAAFFRQFKQSLFG